MKHKLDKLWQNRKWQYIVVILSAIFFSFSIQMFVIVAHTFTTGLSSIAMIPGFVWTSVTPFISLIYFALNIPLIIYFWKKVKKDFIFKTIVFLVTQSIVGILFYIDEFKDPLRSLIVDPDTVLDLIWPIFVLAPISGVIVGVATAFAWKAGGSSGGSDIITNYFSVKKKKSIGSMTFIVSLFFLAISFAVTISIKSEMRGEAIAIFISTLISMAFSSAVVSQIYPKYSLVYVEIHSDLWKEINSHFKNNNYIHSWQIRPIVSGFTGKEKKIIATSMFLLELKEIRKQLIAIDKKVWVKVIPIRKIYGNFNTQNVD